MSDEMTYKAAGVDIEAGYEAVRRIRTLAQSTYGPEVLNDIGAFGGFYALDIEFKEPVLVWHRLWVRSESGLHGRSPRHRGH